MSEIGTYVASYKGQLVYPKGTSLNIRSKPSTTSTTLINIKSGQKAGTATGNYLNMADGKWFQIETDTAKKFGYVREDVIVFQKSVVPTTSTAQTAQTVTEKQANDLVSKLVESDKAVFERLLRITPLLQAAKAKGKNIVPQENQFRLLSERLAKRQEAIKSSKVVKWQAGIKKGYNKLIGLFKNMFGMSGIGEPITITTTVVVTAVCVAGLGITAYYLFKPTYSESQTDLKVSSDLETLLSKAEPDTAQKIKEDLETQIDEAYNQGKTDQSFSSIWSIGKYVLIFGAGYFLVTKFVNTQSKNK